MVGGLKGGWVSDSVSVRLCVRAISIIIPTINITHKKIQALYMWCFLKPNNQNLSLDYVLKKLYLCYAINDGFKRLNESEMKAVKQSERYTRTRLLFIEV